MYRGYRRKDHRPSTYRTEQVNQYGSEWQQCGRKQAFSCKQARKIAKKYRQREYRCPLCSNWHLTHTPE